MAKSFRTCCVALPVALAAHPTVLQLACDPRCVCWGQLLRAVLVRC